VGTKTSAWRTEVCTAHHFAREDSKAFKEGSKAFKIASSAMERGGVSPCTVSWASSRTGMVLKSTP